LSPLPKREGKIKIKNSYGLVFTPLSTGEGPFCMAQPSRKGERSISLERK
jgi:hypothetical protein